MLQIPVVQPGGVFQQDAQQAAAGVGAVDRPVEALFHQRGQQTGMVKVHV